MKLFTAIKKLIPRHPFTLARGTKHFVENVFVKIEDELSTGIGEAAPNRFYGENPKNVKKILMNLEPHIHQLEINKMEDISTAWENLWGRTPSSRAAQCALDIAMWDYLARKKGATVHSMIFAGEPVSLTSSVTAALCSEKEWRIRMSELEKYPIIKIKLDSSGSLPYVNSLRKKFPHSKLWADANCSLSSQTLPLILPELKACGVEILEQPFPPKILLNEPIIPLNETPLIIADESCRELEDIPSVTNLYHGINIKLAKCGGLTPALEMIKKARIFGLKIMVGCMLESECGIAAGLVAANHADFVDLDGNWLLENKLFQGLEFTHGMISVSSSPGFGTTPLPGSFTWM